MYKIIGADGKEYGPVSVEMLRQWITQGRIGANSKVRLESETEWMQLASIPEFASEFATAPAAPPPASAPTRTSGLAISSLVLGILGVFSCGLTALVGLILGIVGLTKIKKSEGRLSGSGLAIAGIVVSGIFLLMLPLFAAMLLPALAKAKAKAQAIQCLNNAKQISLGIMMVTDANTNICPEAATWCDDVLPEVGANTIFLCSAGDPNDRCHFALNQQLAGKDITEVKNPATTVMIFESDGGWNLNGGSELLLREPRHNQKLIVGFVDGHVEMLATSQLAQLNWAP